MSELITPVVAFERFFFAVFSQTSNDDVNPMPELRPQWTRVLFKLTFGTYLLVALVLINLLIAMMTDTYQRIQVIWELLLLMDILVNSLRIPCYYISVVCFRVDDVTFYFFLVSVSLSFFFYFRFDVKLIRVTDA